jgi:hypothetical protein
MSDFLKPNQTLPGALAAELVRVTVLRAQYEETERSPPQAFCGPAIAHMTAAINDGIEAAG